MLVIGLTGGIATGKSTVSELLKAKKVPLIDADVLARQVVLPGTPALRNIVHVFGNDILLPDGTLDRKKLGGIIFTDEGKRKILNGIVHPAVRRAMFRKVLHHWISGERFCVVDVPLLIEGGLWRYVGKVVVVYCSSEVQLQRLMQRDKSTEEDASARLNSQLPITEKLIYADVVIDNSGSLQDLETQVNSLVEKVEKSVRWMWWFAWLFPPYAVISAAALLGWRWIWSPSRQRQKRIEKQKAK